MLICFYVGTKIQSKRDSVRIGIRSYTNRELIVNGERLEIKTKNPIGTHQRYQF